MISVLYFFTATHLAIHTKAYLTVVYHIYVLDVVKKCTKSVLALVHDSPAT